MQYKQGGRAVECHLGHHRDRWGGNIVYAEHGQDCDEVFGARGIAVGERVNCAMHSDDMKRPTRR